MSDLSRIRGKNLVIDVEELGISFVFDADTLETVSLGRIANPTTNQVDLSDYGALEKGVSRQHAQIVRHQDELCVVDTDSTSGTYINGMQLRPHKPVRLRYGDNLNLGLMSLHVRFEFK